MFSARGWVDNEIILILGNLSFNLSQVTQDLQQSYGIHTGSVVYRCKGKNELIGFFLGTGVRLVRSIGCWTNSGIGIALRKKWRRSISTLHIILGNLFGFAFDWHSRLDMCEKEGSWHAAKTPSWRWTWVTVITRYTPDDEWNVCPSLSLFHFYKLSFRSSSQVPRFSQGVSYSVASIFFSSA